MSLQIQHAHRSLAQKLAPEATPRSIVINFLQFDIRETVLKLAWNNKVHINIKQILFDHDYAYKVIRGDGEVQSLQTYEEATEAAQELWVQGLQVTVTREDAGRYIEESTLKVFPWQL